MKSFWGCLFFHYNTNYNLIYRLNFQYNSQLTSHALEQKIICELKNVFGPMSHFLTTACNCLGSWVHQKCYLICLPLSFVKTSLHLHRCALRHFVPTTEASASRVCLPIFLFSFNFFASPLLQGTVCHRAEQVLLTGCDVWVRMHNGLAGHFYSLSSWDHGEIFYTGVNMCHLRCHCWALAKSPELKINQSANSQMSWSLIPKLLALLSTFPWALQLYFEIISLDFDMLLSEII